MVSRFPVLLFLLVYLFSSSVSGRQLRLDSNDTLAADVSAVSSPDCTFSREETEQQRQPTFVLNVKHHGRKTDPVAHVADSKVKDLSRLKNLNSRIAAAAAASGNTVSGVEKFPAASGDLHELMMATLESGVSVGSGEYLMDVFIGTPPKHFSMIVDTGSDLNWIQCVPCDDCFEQTGPYYDPHESSSFRQISCRDERCPLVNSPPNSQTCVSENQSCPYYYWYGDSSNTTGELALETFTVNLTTGANGEAHFRKVENVIFGCGHRNRGLFHGAAGLLGLGRGPLSFSSQLRSLFGHSFSYCLVDRNSNSSVSSKLIFGQEIHSSSTNRDFNFTALLSSKQDAVDTFYYVHIKSVIVGGETLNIPEETWDSGGTIIDSGTTLSYFADPAYTIIKEAFTSKMKRLYPVVEDFPILESCYNVSGVREPKIPAFGIRFSDGAEWNFPTENFVIKVEPEDVICLAMLGAPRSGLSIIGNYQQQNFHIVYDVSNSRLGFKPTKCSEL